MSDPLGVQINAPTLDKLIANYAKINDSVQKHQHTGMERATMIVERSAKQKVKRDTGHLRRSIMRRVIKRADEVVGQIGSNAPHAYNVEMGRKAGSRMPPKGALLDWMRRHGIDAEMEYVVRRAIARKGIEEAPYLRPAVKDNLALIRRELGQQTVDRVLADMRSGR
jgi:hypothetical protein